MQPVPWQGASSVVPGRNGSTRNALGIVMATEHVSRECAWDLLRSVSQHQHRKVRVIAAEVVETGGLPVAGRAPA